MIGDSIGSPVKATDTLSLDKKLDDGNPIAGNFYAWTDPGGAGLPPCISGSDYIIDNDYKCSFSITFKGLRAE